jgi:hypothetical protein
MDGGKGRKAAPDIAFADIGNEKVLRAANVSNHMAWAPYLLFGTFVMVNLQGFSYTFRLYLQC